MALNINSKDDKKIKTARFPNCDRVFGDGVNVGDLGFYLKKYLNFSPVIDLELEAQ